MKETIQDKRPDPKLSRWRFLKVLAGGAILASASASRGYANMTSPDNGIRYEDILSHANNGGNQSLTTVESTSTAIPDPKLLITPEPKPTMTPTATPEPKPGTTTKPESTPTKIFKLFFPFAGK